MAPIKFVVPVAGHSFVWYIGDETKQSREDASIVIPTEAQAEQQLCDLMEQGINPNHSSQTAITRSGKTICLELEMQNHLMHIPWSLVNKHRIEYSDSGFNYTLSAKSGPEGCLTIRKGQVGSNEYEKWTLHNFKTNKNPSIEVKNTSNRVLLPLKQWSVFLYSAE